MNLLDGRILHEFRQLAGAMRDAKVSEPSILIVCSKLIQRAGKKKSATEGAATPQGRGA